LNLPQEFIHTIENGYGEKGKRFIASLPALVEEASLRWEVANVQPVSNLSYNLVAFANRGDDKVVLKIGVPNRELTSEMFTLKLFRGKGACLLIDCDEEKGFLLLERLQPGKMLSTLQDDEEATHIAAEVMQKIWRSLEHVSVVDKFIQLSDWFDGLKRLRAMFQGGTGPLNETLVDRVEQSVRDFFSEYQNPVLMHGDFHHFNILSSERGWLVIDPKGVIGPAGYEVGPLLMNPWSDLLNGRNYQGITKRRIDILHERLGFERERIREWGLAHAVLSAWWGIEDNTGWEYSMSFAEMLADLPLNL
jgi:streptomycin 6-kinase